MRRLIAMGLLLALLLSGAPALAQEAGSRIGTTPQVPLGPRPAAKEATSHCASLRGAVRERCLREAKMRAPATPTPSGPESTGMGSGAGTGPRAGTSGGASFGGSAPR